MKSRENLPAKRQKALVLNVAQRLLEMRREIGQLFGNMGVGGNKSYSAGT